MVAQYIATRTILDLCEETVRKPGAWFSRRWWDQYRLYLSDTRTLAASADGQGGIEGGEKKW